VTQVTWNDKLKSSMVVGCIPSPEDLAALKAAGFSLYEGTWICHDLARCCAVWKFCDSALRARLTPYINTNKASSATDSQLPVPVPDGKQMRSFQKAGIDFMLKHPNCMNASPMGLGKTVMTAGMINCLTEEQIRQGILIVCPANLKVNWQRELLAWLHPPRKAAIVDVTGHGDRSSGIYIVNYAQLDKLKDLLQSINWYMAVADESHYIQNPKAIRSKVFRSLKRERLVLLSGTPLSNRPRSLWNQLSMIDPIRWGTYRDFAMEFCNGYVQKIGNREILMADGTSNPRTLNIMMRATCMYRVEKEKVLADLPPKQIQIIPLEVKDNTIIKKNKEIEESGDFTKVLKELEDGGTVDFTEVSQFRHELGVLKQSAVITHIKDTLESEEKVVVFAHHRDVLSALWQGLQDYEPVALSGGTPPAQKQEAIDRFQTRPENRVFIGSINAAGVGITLTAASVCIFAEIDWSASQMNQCIDRLHRIGQPSPVLAQYLVLDQTMDIRIARLLESKQRTFDKVVTAEELAVEEFLN